MSVGNVTIRQLQDSIEAHRRLLAAANKKADDAQAQLIRIGLSYCGGQFDQLQKGGLALDTASPETLGEVIINSLKVLQAGADQQGANWPARLNELNARVETLQKEVDAQTRRANLAEEKVVQLQRQATSLDQSLSRERTKKQAMQGSGESVLSIENYSEWLGLWMKKKSFERDEQVVRLIGETGYSRLSEIQQLLVQRSALGERAAYRGVEACEKEELIERRDGVSIDGRPTDLIFLTAKGRWVYSQQTGKSPSPAEFERLLKAHKSSRHTSLILKTADHFTTLGFQIEREPVQIKVGENRFFQPDLVARKDGEVYYLEVESGEREDRASLLQKWENAFIAGGGRICVVAARSGVMNSIQSMILNWATENGKRLTLYITHLEALKACKPGDRPWVRIR